MMKLTKQYDEIVGIKSLGGRGLYKKNITPEIAKLEAEIERLRDEILRENTKFGQVERDDLIG